MGTHINGTIPTAGLRYPDSPRPADAAYVAKGGLLEARIIREVQRWTAARPSRCAAAPTESMAVGL
jgi:hypothetical protein